MIIAHFFEFCLCLTVHCPSIGLRHFLSTLFLFSWAYITFLTFTVYYHTNCNEGGNIHVAVRDGVLGEVLSNWKNGNRNYATQLSSCKKIAKRMKVAEEEAGGSIFKLLRMKMSPQFAIKETSRILALFEYRTRTGETLSSFSDGLKAELLSLRAGKRCANFC